MMTTHTNPARAQVRNALIVATLFVAFSLTVTFGVTEQSLRERLMGIAMGALVAFYGNAAAKTLTPLSRLRCSPAAEQSLRRFTAWCLTLAGLAYIVAYLAFPADQAVVIATSILGAAVVLVAGRVFWAKRRGTRS